MTYLNINLNEFYDYVISIVLNVSEKPKILILTNGIKLFEYFTSILTPKYLCYVYNIGFQLVFRY